MHLTSDILNLFYYSLTNNGIKPPGGFYLLIFCVTYLKKCLPRIFSCFNQVICIFAIEFHELFMFGMLITSNYIWKHFLKKYRLFILLSTCKETFLFDLVLLIYFSISCSRFWCGIQKTLLNSVSGNISSIFSLDVNESWKNLRKSSLEEME